MAIKPLSEKIEESISLIKKGEQLALSLNPDGYFVGFSGGKDSQVLLDLVRQSGVKYKAYYSVTTNDPPDNVYFIRQHYPDVIFLQNHVNLYRHIAQKGAPTIFHRWCCKIFKEGAGAGYVVLTGVRREESKKRKKYPTIDVRSNRKEHANRTAPYTIEGFIQAQHQCIKGQDKIMIYPIAEWTSTDIWVYIAKKHLPVNPCYENTGRVGCMFCPYSSPEQIEFYEHKYPKFYQLFIFNLETYLKKRGGDDYLCSVQEYYDWWKSGKTLKEFLKNKRQLSLKF